jgi:tetratricopeptide (TPR) repeat protein
MNILFAAVAALCSAFSQQHASADSPQQIVQAIDAAKSATDREDWKTVRKVIEPVVRQARTNGEVWQLLGRAQFYGGDIDAALGSYERVFELGHGVPSAIAFRIAVCHARLGQADQAMQWLTTAKAIGLRDIDDAWAEPALTALHADRRFVALFGPKDVKGLSRVEGWNLDLDILSTEVKRKGVHPFRVRTRDEVEWAASFTESQFDDAVNTLRSRLATLNDQQVGTEIMRLLRQIGDGHTGAFAPEDSPAALSRSLPLLTFHFEEGHYVVAAAKRYAHLLGARVTHIENIPIDNVANEVEKIISRDNVMWVPQVMPYQIRNASLLKALGLVPQDERVRLAVQREGRAAERVEVVSNTTDGEIWNVLPAPADWLTYHDARSVPKPLSLQRLGEHYWIEHLLDRNTIYLQYNKVINKEKGESLTQLSERLDDLVRANPEAKLIVDLRWNNGGDTFLNERLLHKLLQHPGLYDRGRFVVLIGRRTFSAAMNAALFFERFFDPVFIGEPTGGKPNSPGDEVWETLPYSRMQFNVSDVLWQSGWPYDYRPWIAPDIEIEPTFADYTLGRDRALEAAFGINPLPSKR